MKIQEMCDRERPRGRLLSYGPSSLGDSDLLAILLRTGTGGKNVVEVASELLNLFGGSLPAMGAASVDVLRSVPGIGRDKACTIAAAFELGRRAEIAAAQSGGKGHVLADPETVYRIVRPRLRGLDHEQMWIVYLGRKLNFISMEMLSKGGLSSTVIDPRTIISRALEKKASGIIMVHNHPSGSPYPGTADIEQTARLKKALEPFDIKLLDHLVVADGAYYSFSEEKAFKVLKIK
ncbi:MAG: DNA repair protein RadC [Bacteroidales bacterium]|nr:DNA repair protein RadC [Bacteroidales bacterium]